MNTASSQRDRPTLLIVDDTPENITVLGELLQPYYSVKVATNGQRALVSANASPRPDLILLDVMMPEMDGYAVLARLRDNPETADIPVIFVTAMDAADDETRGLEMGAADYITKPLRPAIVLARIRSQLELKHARDRMRHQNAWLESEVQRRMHQNQSIQDASMRALASLAETRDNETGNHIIRTQKYVQVLCQELVRKQHPALLDTRYVELIVKAAPLHDIGKVGIPDHILLKPGELSENEWLIMRTHTTLGASAIERAIQDEKDQSTFDFFHIAMEIARYHHEHWDGSGYPAGLKGEQIPLPARLMAIADVFDALLHRRCYKKPIPLDKALEIIEQGKGTQFDPIIVDAFLNCRNEIIDIAEKFADI